MSSTGTVEPFRFPEVQVVEGARSTSRSGACVHCKSLKVKCIFEPRERACKRCQAGGHDCLARDRKKRKPAPTHEDLQEKSYEQDQQIEELLAAIDQIKYERKIQNFLVKNQSDTCSTPEMVQSDIPDTGVVRFDHPKREYVEASAELAVCSAFPNAQAPGTQFHSFRPPDIVKYCNLFPDEINELFKIYFCRVNSSFSILDPEMHTPTNLIWTSPFLFTVICAVASRYYSRRPIYTLAMDFARDAAGRALVDGSKSVDICQAYLLMALYPIPKKKWAEDRSWLLMGVAIRMAIELELNQPPPAACSERESLNRTRTWLNCYCVDGSHATQFGKLPMIRLDDYLARHSRNWYKSSSFNLKWDIHLCAYVDMIRLMAEFRSAIGHSGKPQEDADVTLISIHFDKRLSDLIDSWVNLYADDPNGSDPLCQYRVNTTQMITSYLKLVVLSLGFQLAVKRGVSRDDYVVTHSIAAARMTIEFMTRHLYPSGYLSFTIDAQFLYVAFAAAFLINFLRPKFIVLLDENQKLEIISLVQELIEILGSNAVALDGRHTPALYSKFLSSLLARQNIPTTQPRTNTSSPIEITPEYGTDRQQTPPHVYAWPDTSMVLQNPYVDQATDCSGLIFQVSGEVEMDFSIQHFMSSVSAQNAVCQPQYNSFGDWGDLHSPRTNPAPDGRVYSLLSQ